MFTEPGSTRPRRSARDIRCSAGVEPGGIPGAFATAPGIRTGRIAGGIASGLARGVTYSKAGELSMSALVIPNGGVRANVVSEIAGHER